MSIVGMIFGVISFTFVVSNINSMLSQSNKSTLQRSKNFSFLEKMNLKYKLSPELIEMATKEINKHVQNHSDNFYEMINTFPVNLRNDLYYSMFKNNLNQINFFKDLPPDIIIVLGQALTPIIYTKGIPNNQIAGSTPKVMSPKKSFSFAMAQQL